MTNINGVWALLVCGLVWVVLCGCRAGPAAWAQEAPQGERIEQLNERLFRAIERRDAEAVEALLRSGADPNAVQGAWAGNPKHWMSSALSEAARLGEVDIVKLLLQHGAEPRKNTPLNGYEPLNAAIVSYQPGTAEVIKVLIDAGADASTPPPEPAPYVEIDDWHRRNRASRIDLRLRTQLHELVAPGRDARRHDPEAAANKVRMLLDMGVPLNNTDNLDRTPLIVLVAEGRYQGRESQLNVLRELLSREGLELDAQDVDGRTPLHWAVANMHAEVVHMLLDAGARTDLHDEDGRTVAELARQVYPRRDVLKVLGLEAAPVPQSGIRAHVHASRSEGVAPLAVFFDGVGTDGLAGNDFVNAHYDWEFDVADVDPGHPRPTAIGFNVAHVFRKPGEYTVRVRVKDAMGREGETTTTIKVRPFDGRSFYVAADGDDAGPGTMHQPWRSFTHALERAEPNTRILFRRGDTFPTEGAHLVRREGPVIVGAYADPASPSQDKPLIDGTGGVTLQGVEDWRFRDLHFRGQSTERSGPNAGHGQFATHTVRNVLWWNVEFERLGQNAITDVNTRNNSDGLFIAECHMHNFGAYGFYSSRGTRIAFVGNRLRHMHGFEHGYRTQGVKNAYVAHNDLRGLAGLVKDAFTIRGPHSSNVVFVHNVFDTLTGFEPAVRGKTFIRNCLVEANVSTCGYFVMAQNMTFRNNRMVYHPVRDRAIRPAQFVGLSHKADNTGVSENLHFYHNTYVGPGFFASAANEIAVFNNIIWGPVGLGSGRPEEVRSDGNLYWAEDTEVLGAWLAGRRAGGRCENSLTGDPQLLSTDPADEDFLKPAPDSPAMDAGVPAGVWRDVRALPRPQGAAPDAGAFEID